MYNKYHDKPNILFENTIHTPKEDLNKIDVFDTAHYYYKLLKDGANKDDITLPDPSNFKFIHLNGLDKKSFE